MSLSTKQRRGSAMLIGLPYRPWISEPDGNVDFGSRLSMLRYCSAIVDETIPSNVPGAEWVAGNERFHWRAGTGRLHWVAGPERLHWVAEEE